MHIHMNQDNTHPHTNIPSQGKDVNVGEDSRRFRSVSSMTRIPIGGTIGTIVSGGKLHGTC